MYALWESQGRKWFATERVTGIKLEHSIILSVYQPVAGSENYEKDLENLRSEVERIMTTHGNGKFFLMGGDFNAHIAEENRFGLRSSNAQGLELLDWLTENELVWINSQYQHNFRGTWFNKSVKRWYELDGSATRWKDKQKIIRKMSTANHRNLSDHNAKMIVMSPEFLNTKKRKFFKKR